MNSTTNIQDKISLILLVGILAAIGLVFLGGIIYLFQVGNENLQMELLQSITYKTSLKQIISKALSLSPLGIIELGLMILVITQLLRIALLTWFYFIIRDYWFTVFSIFILSVLVYSLIWRN